MKEAVITLADCESLIKNVDRCKNNPKKSSATRVAKHILSGFTNSRILPFKSTEKSMMYTEVNIALKVL